MRYFLNLLIVFFIVGYDYTSDKATNSMNTSNHESKIIEISSNLFRYDHYDGIDENSHFSYLTDKGYQGGGYTWEGIIYGALKLEHPQILKVINFDAEGDGVVISSSSKVSLIEVAKVVDKLKKDQRFMDKAILIAEENDQIE